MRKKIVNDMTVLYRTILTTSCPRCYRAKANLLKWRIAAVIGWALLFILITLAK